MFDAPEAAVPHARTAWPVAMASIVLIGLLDLAGTRYFALAFSGWALPCTAVSGLLMLSLVYRTIRPWPTLAELPLYAASWVAFSVLAAINTYLAASLRLPLQDAAFGQVDRWLGFDWLAWVHAVRAHPACNLLLRLAYASLPWQIVVSLALFAFARIPGRNAELLAGAAVALLLTALLSGLLPALGPFVHYGTGGFAPQDAAYVAHVLALRSIAPPVFALGGLQGIVTFPSYHASLAVLFCYAHRGLRWSSPAVAALNVVMLLSIASEGGHYLVDILAGAALAVLVILALRSAQERRCAAPNPAGA